MEDSIYWISLILWVIAMWTVIDKAGECGALSLVPIYNKYLLYKVANIKSTFYVSLIATVVAVISGLSYSMSLVDLVNGASVVTSSGSYCLIGILVTFICRVSRNYHLILSFSDNKGLAIACGIGTICPIVSTVCLLVVGISDKYKYKNNYMVFVYDKTY